MRSDASVFLFLTEQCNLTCSHCYVSSGPARTVSMPNEITQKTLDVFGASGVDDFRLTGGEPTIHPRFESILETIAARGHRVRLVSNGKKLYHNPNAKRLLSFLDVCWISAYGTTPERHARVAGAGAFPLCDLERWVGELAGLGFRIGLSVLLCPGDSEHINDLLRRTSAVGVRRLRLLPVEPDGRAASISNGMWARWPSEVKIIYDLLLASDNRNRFDVLTLNDPFDLCDRLVRGEDSCLLHSRRMWSVTPNGDIYSCCFNVYQPAHRVCNIRDSLLIQQLSGWALPANGKPCRAFDDGFWRDVRPKKTTCPISALSLATGTS